MIHEPRKVKSVTRDRRLTPEEAARYRNIRKQIEADLPELIARHRERIMNEELERLQKENRDLLDTVHAMLKAATGLDGEALEAALSFYDKPSDYIAALKARADGMKQPLYLQLICGDESIFVKDAFISGVDSLGAAMLVNNGHDDLYDKRLRQVDLMKYGLKIVPSE